MINRCTPLVLAVKPLLLYGVCYRAFIFMKMTPSEKAIELLAKFKKTTTYQYQEYAGANYSTFEHDTDTIKECCLLTVEEILKAIPMYTGNLNSTWKFWSDVRDCLNAL